MKASVILLSLLALSCLAAYPLAKGRSHVVTINDMRFDPATIQISKGDVIAWTNNDDRDHTVEAADGSFKSGNLSNGKSFKQTFAKPGTFNYGCGYHPRMKGTVEVTE
jgi:plastocyanin